MCTHCDVTDLITGRTIVGAYQELMGDQVAAVIEMLNHDSRVWIPRLDAARVSCGIWLKVMGTEARTKVIRKVVGPFRRP